MKLLKSGFYYFAIILVIVLVLSEEVEARRKILRGRKTITRTYYKSTGVPAWAIVILVGLGMLLAGGGLYAILKKVILDPATSYKPPPMQNDV